VDPEGIGMVLVGKIISSSNRTFQFKSIMMEFFLGYSICRHHLAIYSVDCLFGLIVGRRILDPTPDIWFPALAASIYFGCLLGRGFYYLTHYTNRNK
jgi:hypothetical protein